MLLFVFAILILLLFGHCMSGKLVTFSTLTVNLTILIMMFFFVVVVVYGLVLRNWFDLILENKYVFRALSNTGD